MASAKDTLLRLTWNQNNDMISTDPTLIPLPALNDAFASELVYWADPLPETTMRETLDNSLCFGMYQIEAPSSNDPTATTSTTAVSARTLTGFARCVTDFTTFVYLTDVYVDPSCQGKGLGAWLMSCVEEAIESMPYLRRIMLVTSDWKRSVPFYEKVLKMSVVDCKVGGGGEVRKGPAFMQRIGPGFPTALLPAALLLE